MVIIIIFWVKKSMSYEIFGFRASNDEYDIKDKVYNHYDLIIMALTLMWLGVWWWLTLWPPPRHNHYGLYLGCSLTHDEEYDLRHDNNRILIINSFIILCVRLFTLVWREVWWRTTLWPPPWPSSYNVSGS